MHKILNLHRFQPSRDALVTPEYEANGNHIGKQPGTMGTGTGSGSRGPTAQPALMRNPWPRGHHRMTLSYRAQSRSNTPLAPDSPVAVLGSAMPRLCAAHAHRLLPIAAGATQLISWRRNPSSADRSLAQGKANPIPAQPS